MKIIQGCLFLLMLNIMACTLYAQDVEVRNVPSFSRIISGGSWDVILQKGDQPAVRIEAKNLDLNRVVTEVKNNTLNIYLEKGSYRNMHLKVYVTFVELEAIKTSGSGNFQCHSDLQSENLAIVMSGSGDADFQKLRADQLEVTMSGSGNLNIAGGAVETIAVDQSGSGNFSGQDLQTEQANINKSGSGNLTLTVNRSLTVRSSGSGNVQYKGNPSHNDIRISGSGRVSNK